MLAAAVLSAAASTISCFSPLRNPCRVRNGRQFRHEPYMASVIPSPLKIETPSARQAREVAEQTAQAILAQQQQEMIANFYSSMDSVVTASETSEESAAAAAPFDPSASSQTVTSSSSSVPPANAAGERFVIVQFKHETCMYRAPFRVAVGDVVVVEADRGENIGTVMELCTALPTYDVPNRVARRANLEEQRSLANLRTQETRITVDVQKAAESVGLGIRVVDTEFQTDMNKLTVYFSSRAPVDFRKLQRTLFREYRCRIWLVNWSEVEFRKRQADRCLGISICSKLGSRLSSVKQSASSAAGSRRQSQ